MTNVSAFSEEISENQQNVRDIRCNHCNSLVLLKNTGTFNTNEVLFFRFLLDLWIYSFKCFVKLQFSLPLMHQKKSQPIDDLESEVFLEFWEIDDMFKFENIGFSNTVGNYKYLICADCEMGPVGYHEIQSKKCFIALKRVKHE